MNVEVAGDDETRNSGSQVEEGRKFVDENRKRLGVVGGVRWPVDAENGEMA